MVPVGEWHQIMNTSNHPCHIIEIQYGESCYENDIDPNIIKNIPYASMLVRIGKGPTALMILESINEDSFTWVSADGVYLVTKNGKIVKTGCSDLAQELEKDGYEGVSA